MDSTNPQYEYNLYLGFNNLLKKLKDSNLIINT